MIQHVRSLHPPYFEFTQDLSVNSAIFAEKSSFRKILASNSHYIR